MMKIVDYIQYALLKSCINNILRVDVVYLRLQRSIYDPYEYIIIQEKHRACLSAMHIEQKMRALHHNQW